MTELKAPRLEMWPVDKPIDYAQNAKKHPKEQLAALAKVIREQGFDQPIVVDADGVIIKGHGRRAAAHLAGLTQVPVIIRDDLSPEQVRVARLTDNKVAALSDIDTEMLRLEMADMNIDLLKGVFTDKELDFTLSDLGEMNPGAFVPDLSMAVDNQERETEQKVEEMKKIEIPIVKALGFKSIAGEDEIHVARFMAELERKTGAKGREAFVTYAKAVTAKGSQ